MNFFWKTFIKGLAAMIPLVVTLWVITWLVVNAEAMLGSMIKSVLPEHLYVRGMGVVMGLVFVFCVGLLLNMVVARVMFHRFELMLNRLPLVKSVYGSVKDLMGFFMDSEKKGQQVVMVTLWPEADQLLDAAVTPSYIDGQSSGLGTLAVTEPEVDADVNPAAEPSDVQPSQVAPTGKKPKSLVPRRVPMRLLGLVTREAFDDLPKGIGDEHSVAVYLPMSYQLGGFTVIVRRAQIEPVAMSTEDALRFAITAGMNAKALVHK